MVRTLGTVRRPTPIAIKSPEKPTILPPHPEEGAFAITRAHWDATPKEYRRTWKDGTRLIAMAVTPTLRRWTRVTWNN